MTVNFAGHLYDDAGNAVSGASVKLLETGTTTQEGSTDTTDSDGAWSFAEADQDRYDVEITSGSSVRRIRWDDQISLKELDARNNTGATTPAATFSNITDAVANQVAVFSGANATRADNDEIYLSFKLADSAGNLDEFARMTAVATDVTSGSEDGQIEFDVIKAGTLTKVWTITSSTSAAMSFDMNVDALTIGSGADTDVSLTFDANSADGVITWMEDEDYFKFSDDILMDGTEKISFNDTGEYISGDGTDLTIGSGGAINLTATTDVVIPANVGITFGSGEKIEGDSTDITVTSGAKINLTATSDVVIPSGVGLILDGSGSEKIESDGTDISISVGASGDINIPADIGLTFGDDGEKIEGDGTDLTIAGNNINLTATADVVIPADVGITFGSGEKIEGDDTDLTVTSGAKINLTATSDVVIPSGVGLVLDGSGSEKIESDGTDIDISVGANGDINIPANIGLTFGDDGEKIEGDGTDLTIAGNTLTLDATTDVVVPDGTGLLVGHSSNLVIGGQNPEMQMSGTAIADNIFAVNHFSGDTNRPARFWGVASKNASLGGHTAVADGHYIVEFSGIASNGTNFNNSAAIIRAEAVGTHSGTNAGGDWVFLTTTEDATSPSEKMRLDDAGDLTFSQATTISTSTGDLDLTSAGNMDITVQGNAAASLKISDGTTNILYPDFRTGFGTIAWLTWNKGATGFASASGLTPWFFRLMSGTMTLTGTTTVTAMNGVMMEIGAQTITDSSSVTITKASSLYIKNVAAAGSVTITNNYAIDTEAGAFLTAAGVWTDNPSTLAKKNNVLDISPDNLRGAIRAIHPRQWVYKDEWNDAGQQRYGIVAEELPRFLKPLGSTQNDVVQPSIMAGFALAGVHHLEDRITQLEAQLAALS